MQGLFEPNKKLGIAIPTVPATGVVLKEITIPHANAMGLFEIKNAGANAFDLFVVQMRAHVEGTWITVATAVADFTTPIPPIISSHLSVGTDPNTLAGGESALLHIDCRGVQAIRFGASANDIAGVTTAELYYVIA